MIGETMIEKLRGVRDFYPKNQYGRRAIYETLYNTLKRFGFKEVCTPSIESLEMITKKSGAGIVDEIYAFKDKGGRDICLIPELTPSIARMVVQRQKELRKPIKWCSFSRHWRYERPQKGRQREFYQFNADILGVRSSRSDFEIIAAGIECMLFLGLSNFKFHISNRKILESFFDSHGIPAKEAFTIVDKRSKVSEEEFKEMLRALGATEECYLQLTSLLDISGTVSECIPKISDALKDTNTHVKEALDNLKEMGAFIDHYGFSKYCMIDLSIVRGLAYYTDMVFEVFDKKKSMRSLFGGGRYDDLIELFDGQKTPAVGFAIGIPMLEILMKEEGKWPEPDFGPDYFVIMLGNVEKEAFALIKKLRESSTVEYALTGKNMKNQMNEANSIGAKNTIIIGERDLENGTVTVKDMKTGTQESVQLDKFMNK